MHKLTHNGHTTHDLYADYEKLKKAFTEGTQEAKEKVSEILSGSIEELKENTSHLTDHMSDYANSVSKFVSKKPYHAIGIAVATGFLLSYWLRK